MSSLVVTTLRIGFLVLFSFIGMCNLLFILHFNKPCIQVYDCKFACVLELKNFDFPTGTGSMFSSHLSPGPWPGQHLKETVTSRFHTYPQIAKARRGG